MNWSPPLRRRLILSASSWGNLYNFKPVSSVAIWKRTRSTVGYGIFDESEIRIYFILVQTASCLPLCFGFHGFRVDCWMFAMGRKVEIISFVFRFYGIIQQLWIIRYSEARQCYLLQIFIIHFLLNPVINYSLFSFHPRSSFKSCSHFD